MGLPKIKNREIDEVHQKRSSVSLLYIQENVY